MRRAHRLFFEGERGNRSVAGEPTEVGLAFGGGNGWGYDAGSVAIGGVVEALGDHVGDGGF